MKHDGFELPDGVININFVHSLFSSFASLRSELYRPHRLPSSVLRCRRKLSAAASCRTSWCADRAGERTDPVLDDVSQAFRLLGVSLSELEDYVHNNKPVHFVHQLSVFPVSKNNILQFPQPGDRDTEERKDYIPDYMPPLVSLQEEEEEVLADMGTSAEAIQVALEEEEEIHADIDTRKKTKKKNNKDKELYIQISSINVWNE
ncbi:transcription initiation factor TFIID subunit 3-like isoform X3 [Antennarius striatus]|uniref:transcription initiation factor TFIID subunit 3-like isoform X3 n=1 Tax=Antennarius striatus TaxID=241820 RepID=UPI0035B3C90F